LGSRTLGHSSTQRRGRGGGRGLASTSQWSHIVPLARVPPANQPVIGKVASKGAAGFANYVLIRRLGDRAIRMLQPLAVPSRT